MSVFTLTLTFMVKIQVKGRGKCVKCVTLLECVTDTVLVAEVSWYCEL